MDIIFYSASSDRSHVKPVAEAVSAQLPQARSFVLEHQAPTYPFRIASEFGDQFDSRTAKLFVDVNFVAAHPVPMADFLLLAESHDGMTVGGRFEKIGRSFKFDFPTWDVAYVAPELWQDPGFASFLADLPVDAGPEARIWAESQFYDAFSPRYDLACLVNRLRTRRSNPFEGASPDVGELMRRPVIAA